MQMVVSVTVLCFLALGGLRAHAGIPTPEGLAARALADIAAGDGGQASGRPMGEAALLPPEGAVAGWKKVENLRVFTKADLYGYIDGGAELFLEFGFDNLTLQKYRNGGNEVAVEIYRMTDPGAAVGTYLMKCGKETRDPSFRARHTLNRHQLMFQRHRYYVTINNLSGSSQMGAELLKFGTLVAGKLPPDVPPGELKRLPPAGLVAGTERLFRGPFALQSIFTLGDGDILQLGGRITGAGGNYKSGAETSTLLVVDYPDAPTAKKAFAHVQQNLDKYLKPVTSGPGRLVFKDYENKFGSVGVTGKRLEIRLHLIKQP